jgi:hypothetical protein
VAASTQDMLEGAGTEEEPPPDSAPLP